MTRRRAHAIHTLAAVLARNGVACAICAAPFSRECRIEWDHTHQIAMGGADDADNLRPLCVPCHAKKTRADAAARAKVRRLTGANTQRPKRKIGGRYRKKMDGTVERVIGDD